MKFFVIMLLTLLLGGCMSTMYVRSDIPYVAEAVARAAASKCEGAAVEVRGARARPTRHNTMRTEAYQTCVYR
jgi:hypothetical protein